MGDNDAIIGELNLSTDEFIEGLVASREAREIELDSALASSE